MLQDDIDQRDLSRHYLMRMLRFRSLTCSIIWMKKRLESTWANTEPCSALFGRSNILLTLLAESISLAMLSWKMYMWLNIGG